MAKYWGQIKVVRCHGWLWLHHMKMLIHAKFLLPTLLSVLLLCSWKSNFPNSSEYELPLTMEEVQLCDSTSKPRQFQFHFRIPVKWIPPIFKSSNAIAWRISPDVYLCAPSPALSITLIGVFLLSATGCKTQVKNCWAEELLLPLRKHIRSSFLGISFCSSVCTIYLWKLP